MKRWLLIAMVLSLLMTAGCAAEVRTVPFAADATEDTGNIALTSAYNLKSAFKLERSAVKTHFGFDGENKLIGYTGRMGKSKNQLLAVDAQAGTYQLLTETNSGEVMQLELLENGASMVYVTRRDEKKTVGDSIFLYREKDAEPLRLKEFGSGEQVVMLAEKLSMQGDRLCYLWGHEGSYMLGVIDAAQGEQRYYALSEAIPEAITREITVKGLYQSSDGCIAGNILMDGQEYYWQTRLPKEAEKWDITEAWALQNTRLIAIERTRQMQAGEFVYYLTEAGALYRMDSESEERSLIAENVSAFRVSGDEKTVVYLTEKNGVSCVYADRIGENCPTLINAGVGVQNLAISEDGSKIALSYFEKETRDAAAKNIAVFELQYTLPE